MLGEAGVQTVVVETGTLLQDFENVIGGNFADTFTGNSQTNVLTGGDGDDLLTGGGGADHFVYTATTDGLDQITDFSGHGGQDDRLEFDHLAFGDGLAAGGANTGVLDAARFVANDTGATTTSEVFWFNTADSTLYYDADGSDAGAAVAVVKLNNNFALNNTDLLLF